jgi:CubicO group peptidase (beta-lactamase class C family)
MSIKAAIETLQTIVPELMATTVIPGASIAIVHGKEIWPKQWGVVNANTNQPVTAQTAFQAASLSKPVFAYAVLQLVTAGHLDLDTPLITYLPASLQNEDPLFDHIVNEPNLHQITTRHVLSHTPGFPNWAAKDTRLKTSFTPGTRFAYSGEGFQYLQRVVTQMMQQRVDQWVYDAVVQPLNMADARFIVTAEDASRIAVGHDKVGKAEPFWEMPEMGSAYSLHCTAVAYAQFLMAMYRPSPLTTLMLTSQIQVNASHSGQDDWPNLNTPTEPQVGWGLGWGLQTGDNGRFFWQWGDNGIFKAFAAGHVASETAVVIFANSQNGDALWRPILETIFDTNDWPALDWLKRTFD